MDAVDWQTGKTPLECTKYMLDHQLNCDVNFKVGENEEIIKAHKVILIMRSPVFDRMFNGSFCESEKDPVIPDVTPTAFKLLLRYCYYECLDLDFVDVPALYAAQKYMLPLLEKAVRKKLITNLSVSDVWDVYKYALTVQDSDMLYASHMYCEGKKLDIHRNLYGDCDPVIWMDSPRSFTSVREALKAEAFLHIPHKVLLDFLHINNSAGNIANVDHFTAIMTSTHHGISISEVEIFQACNAWAEAECLQQEIEPTGANKRTVLGKCLFLIRFPTMLQEDLTNSVYPTGILTQEEIVSLYQSRHRGPDSQHLVDFPSKERQFMLSAFGPFLNEYPETMDRQKIIYREKSTVCIESEVRVMLSSLWTFLGGNYDVTVRDETSQRSWSMVLNTKDENHRSLSTAGTLQHMDIVPPQVLEVGSRYSVTATPIKDNKVNKSISEEPINFGEFITQVSEIKITHDPETNIFIQGLTLALV